MRRRLFQVVLAVLVLAALPAVARADTIDVTSTDDAALTPESNTCQTGGEGGGPCTLRAAVELADDADGATTINLPAGTYDLTISGSSDAHISDAGYLEIGGGSNQVTIVGAGAGTTKIDASAIQDRVLMVDSDSSLSASGVTITGGATEGLGGGISSDGNLSLDHSVVTGNTGEFLGGGISFVGATLTLDTVTISGNVVNPGEGPGLGGGLGIIGGTVTIDHSAITGNTADAGGGIFEEGGDFPINDSTIAGNTAHGDGGGLDVDFFGSEDLSFDTFYGNTAEGDGATGGNIFVFAGETQAEARANQVGFGAASLRLKGTLIAHGNPSNCSSEAGTVTDGGHNYSDDDGSGCGLTDSTDLLSQNGALGPLADNGGPTQTVALLTGNAAMDAVKSSTDCTVDGPPVEPGAQPNLLGPGDPVTTDQRGESKPIGDGCDIGAFEQHDAAMAVTDSGAIPATVGENQTTTLTQVVSDGGPAPGTNVVYTGTLPAGTTAISATATPNASPAARAFSTRATVTCTASGATVTCPLGLVNTVPADPSDSPSPAGFTISVVVHSSLPGAQALVGHVTADQHNPNPAAATTTTQYSVNGASLALSCTHRPLVLVDVFQKGSRVRLFGAADKSLAGQTVSIVFAGRKTVAKAKVGSDGLFSTTAPLPPKSIRDTNKARYQAVSGKKKSLDLKLARRVVLEPLASASGKVVLKGRVVKPLLAPSPKLVVQRRTSCQRFATVKRFRMPASGRFKLTVPGTGSSGAAVYRISTQVRLSKRVNRRYPTFSLPQVLGFG